MTHDTTRAAVTTAPAETEQEDMLAKTIRVALEAAARRLVSQGHEAQIVDVARGILTAGHRPQVAISWLVGAGVTTSAARAVVAPLARAHRQAVVGGHMTLAVIFPLLLCLSGGVLAAVLGGGNMHLGRDAWKVFFLPVGALAGFVGFVWELIEIWRVPALPRDLAS